MPTWNAAQYLKFDEERTRPCRDLVNRIKLQEPRLIFDLGCGPGTSTAVLTERWPDAQITGLDESLEMITAARERHPKGRWDLGDVATWSVEHAVDLAFSNAVLHWVPDHKALIPRLFAQVRQGGALAWQVPANIDAPAHQLMRDLAASPEWKSHFGGDVREWFVHDLPFYHDLLAPHATHLDFWKTEYIHILDGPKAIVEWYKGSGLRPFLERLDPLHRERFALDYEREIERRFLRQANGKVLFPFLRQFVIAYRA